MGLYSIGILLLLSSLAILFVSLFRTKAKMGLIGVGMLIDVLAFLNLFIPTGSVIIAVTCAVIFLILLILLIREWKTVIG